MANLSIATGNNIWLVSYRASQPMMGPIPWTSASDLRLKKRKWKLKIKIFLMMFLLIPWLLHVSDKNCSRKEKEKAKATQAGKV